MFVFLGLLEDECHPVGLLSDFCCLNKKWIQKAIKKPGALRKSLGVKSGEKIPAGKLSKAAKAPGKLGQRAHLAQTLKGLKK